MRRNVIVTQSLFTCWSSNVSGRAADQRCVFHSETTLLFYIRVVNTFLVMYVCMYVCRSDKQRGAGQNDCWRSTFKPGGQLSIFVIRLV